MVLPWAKLRARSPIAVKEREKESLKDKDHPFVSAAVFVLIAYLIRLGLDPWIGGRSPLLMFTAAIVIAAGRYGAGPGLLAMALSFAAGIFGFIMSSHASLGSADVLVSLGVFFVTGAAMLVFAEHLRASQERTIRLQAELQQAHTESAVGAIAATLAHELNQPLAAASNYIAACKRRAQQLTGDQAQAIISGLQQSEAQIRRTGEIIRHARDLVGNASADRERVSLKAMVERVTNPLRASGICENSMIRMRIDAAADPLEANPIQIEQVLMNLLRNACQAAAGAPSEILIDARSDGEWSTVEVRDHAGGIPEDRLPGLLTAAVRSTHGGLGLGLSISRMIVEAHGGRIWAENNDEGGASFYFRVPRSA
jgi:signal transduction histidine kinase